MTIRTIEQFNELKNRRKFSKYIPVEIAMKLPRVVRELGLDLSTEDECNKSVKVLNKELEKRDSLYAVGFYKKRIGDDTMKSLHRCIVSYEPNVRSYAEANSGINGKPSIGIEFYDADDPINDWIWIATDVLMKARPIDDCCADDDAGMLDFNIRKNYRIVRVYGKNEQWYELQKKKLFGGWKNCLERTERIPGLNDFLRKPAHFKTLEDAVDAYKELFGEYKIEVIKK